MKKPVLVIAIGGNAITKEHQRGTVAEQLANIGQCADSIVELLASGYRVILTHGNGPQVGNLLLRAEAAKGIVPPVPLDVCGAESQGQLGYLIQRTLLNKMRQQGLNTQTVTILTQVMVDRADPAFLNPTKPIGPFYTQDEARELAVRGCGTYKEDSGRGHRRVVPSPKPLSIIEKDVINSLVEAGTLVITAGGGGIPVMKTQAGELTGIEAVIDKDWASSVLASQLQADYLVIVTGVQQVAIHFNRPEMKLLSTVTVSEARQYQSEGHFPAGSMGPKMEAAIDFVEKTGGKAVITSLDKVVEALRGETGTTIVPDAQSKSA